MAHLEQQADQAVREAVDAFMSGRLVPEFEGPTVFETKNSRYRLLDGVVFSAPDGDLVGAELVGWLMDSGRRSVIGSSWQPGARAVLVDRRRGRNIIVTSTTQMLHMDEAGPAMIHPGSSIVHPPHRPSPVPPFSPQKAPIVPSSPPPARATPIPPAQQAPIPQARQVPSPSPSPFPRRVHAPPRPIGSTTGRVPAVAARPLPYPSAPPRRNSPPPPTPLPAPVPLPAHAALRPAPLPVSAAPRPGLVAPPTASTPWELTSGDFEVAEDALEAAHDAERHDTLPDPMELAMEPSPTSTGDAFPLVRPRSM